jgi:hypothetical protein
MLERYFEEEESIAERLIHKHTASMASEHDGSAEPLADELMRELELICMNGKLESKVEG